MCSSLLEPIRTQYRFRCNRNNIKPSVLESLVNRSTSSRKRSPRLRSRQRPPEYSRLPPFARSVRRFSVLLYRPVTLSHPSPFGALIHFAHGGRGLAERSSLASSVRPFTPSNRPWHLSVHDIFSVRPSISSRSFTRLRRAIRYAPIFSSYYHLRTLGARDTYSSSTGGERNENSFGTRGPLESGNSFAENSSRTRGVPPTAIARIAQSPASAFVSRPAFCRLRPHVLPTAIECTATTTSRVADRSRVRNRLHPQISCVHGRNRACRLNVPQRPLRGHAHSRSRRSLP